MFRTSLLATTALVVGAASTFAAHERGTPDPRIPPGLVRGHVTATVLLKRPANGAVVHNNTSHWVPGAIFNDFNRDRNAEFVSWYGLATSRSESSHYQSSHSWFRYSEWNWGWTPVTGNGTVPKKMTFAGYANSSTAEFKGAILSATATGIPGNVIASTSSTRMSDTSLCCTGARTVKFHGAPVLTSGKEYIVAVGCANAPCAGAWNFEDTDFSGAAYSGWRRGGHETYNMGSGTHTYSYSSSYGSPYIPAAGAMIIK